MGELLALKAPGRGRRRHQPRPQPAPHGAVVRPFLGHRHLRMIENIAAHMATLDDAKAEKFLVWHFDVEWARLTDQGVAENEIEKYVYTTARAIWARLHKMRAEAA